MPVKINGSTSGSVTLAAPATGSDVTLTLPAATGTAATSADVTSAVAPMGLVAVAPTSIANSGGSASLSNYTVSFSGVSSVSLNGVFTGDYDNYRVLINLTARSNSDTNLLMRMRASGADNTASSYSRSQVFNIYTGTTLSVNNNTATGDYFFLSYPPADTSSRAVDVLAPKLSARTFIQSNCGNLDSWSLAMGNHNSTTSFDGFTLYESAGTISGTVSVYGYKS